MTDVDICVATYRRPQWLAQLLSDIANQDLGPEVQRRVIVVDNDPAGSAEPVLAALPPGTLQHLYLQQPVKNIALTRNMALNHCRAQWVAWLDDDETVPAHWLRSLLACQQTHAADVVLGPVDGHFPADTPAWVRTAGFFVNPPLPSGTVVEHGGTGNALIRGLLIQQGQRFDERFGLTGGEDTEFFCRLARAGHKLVWCQEARALEHLPEERMTMRWLLRRGFRSGQMLADIVSRPENAAPRIAWAVRQLIAAAINAFRSVLLLPWAVGLSARYAYNLAGNVGQLSTLLRYRFKEYR
jgi:succinoglycan biosynthesis protein ExoM